MRTPHVFLVALLVCSISSTESLLAAQESSQEPTETVHDAATLHFIQPARESDEFKKLSKDNQNSFNCFLDCCEGLLKSDDGYDAEGLNLIQKAKANYPNLALPSYCEGRIFGRTGKDQDAVKAYTRAIELDPEFSEAYARRAVAKMDISAANLSQATEDLKKAVGLKADSWIVSISQGTLCSLQGRFADAMSYFEAAVSKKPSNVDPYLCRADNYLKLKKPDKTIEDCTQALSIKADDAWALATRGYAYLQVSQGKNAVDDFTKEIELFDAKTGRYTDRPGFLGAAYLGRGTAYGLLIDTDHAAPDLDTAASLLKGEMAGGAYLLAGMIKKIKGDYPGAIRALTMASRLLTANEPARKQCEDLINSINAKKTATTPTPSAGKPSPSSALYLTVDGVEETVCTKDGHLTPKYKTKNGALPLVQEVFRTLAPAATYYTNHATQLGDITGANDGFNGFRETVSDHGEKKWIFAQFEADINFERPDDFDHYNLQDVAIVIELNPTNLFILDAAAFENFQSAGDVLYRNGRGVLWYSAK